MRRLLLLFCSLALALAQQGHPLSGTWTGDWAASNTQHTPVTIVMNWDGKNVTGIINPGPDSIPLKSVFVDVTNWTVRIEADAKEHITAEGKLEDIGSYHRTIRGTWHQGNASGAFLLTRD
ncbi:MAG TPA: hypothetical protein VG297_23215 [Bryobacteraceae bacterium]|jgi:hypothetical protein|nr:hypothetical protein [Bryobacteraceae bacterium]